MKFYIRRVSNDPLNVEGAIPADDEIFKGGFIEIETLDQLLNLLEVQSRDKWTNGLDLEVTSEHDQEYQGLPKYTIVIHDDYRE